MVSDEDWMFPPLGPIDAGQLALALVEAQTKVCPAVGRPLEGCSRELAELVGALSRLSSVLVQLLAYSLTSDALTPLALLDVIRAHQQARADLDSLDYRSPFDA
jgi:hypothetical protein